MGVECDGLPPFQFKLLSWGTAIILESVNLHYCVDAVKESKELQGLTKTHTFAIMFFRVMVTIFVRGNLEIDMPINYQSR